MRLGLAQILGGLDPNAVCVCVSFVWCVCVWCVCVWCVCVCGVRFVSESV